MSETKMVELAGCDGAMVKVIGANYEAGGHGQGEQGDWKHNVAVGEDRSKYLKYLSESERYWYQDPSKWFGSEKRKNPA